MIVHQNTKMVRNGQVVQETSYWHMDRQTKWFEYTPLPIFYMGGIKKKMKQGGSGVPNQEKKKPL